MAPQTYTKKTDPGNWQIDRLWKPGDSIQLAIGQKDLTVTPLQMARFYALIANGGKLVTPARRSTRWRSPAARTAARTSAPLRRAAAAAERTSTRRCSRPSRPASTEATHAASRHLDVGVFGTFPMAIAGKTGTAEKVVPRASACSTSPGGAATGRRHGEPRRSSSAR